jgi:hypothetical protein
LLAVLLSRLIGLQVHDAVAADLEHVLGFQLAESVPSAAVVVDPNFEHCVLLSPVLVSAPGKFVDDSAFSDFLTTLVDAFEAHSPE